MLECLQFIFSSLWIYSGSLFFVWSCIFMIGAMTSTSGKQD